MVQILFARNVLTFADNYDLVRCDELFLNQCCPTYVNIALNHESCIDYIIVSSDCLVTNFSSDPDINLSDHLPLRVILNALFHPTVPGIRTALTVGRECFSVS